MKVALVVLFVCVTVIVAANHNPVQNGVYDYHRRIGIPTAFKIRIREREAIEKGQGRIVGGSSTTTLSVPYQAGLIIRFNIISTSVCGGALISDIRVLTAAHCYNDGNNIAQNFQVILGSNFLFSGGTRIDTNSVAIFPGYNPWIAAYDMAVLRIPKVNFSLQIQPIILPSGSELNSNFVGVTALASGYGITKDGDTVNLLQTISSVNLQVISNAACANSYGNIIQNHHLCTNGAGGVGICGGDTGGPLVATVNNRRVLIGIGSFVSSAGCQTGQPSGFSRVTSFVSWIHTI